MEEPPPTATWHPALRPETLDHASLYSPEFSGPRQVTLSWDDMIARTPMRSRAPTHSLQKIEQTMPLSIEEEIDHSGSALQSTNTLQLPASGATSKGVSAEDTQKEELPPSIEKVEDVSMEVPGSEKMHSSEERQINKTVPVQDYPDLEQFHDDHPIPDTDDHPALAISDSSVLESLRAFEHNESESDGHMTQITTDVSASKEPSPFTPQQDPDQNEIDSAWGNIGNVEYTNSFPPVQPVSIEAPATPLPSSQAAAVFRGEQKSGDELDGRDGINTYQWEASGQSFGNEDDGFFSRSDAQEDSQQVPPDDEARYEEGLPLVPHNTTVEIPDTAEQAGPNFDFADDIARHGGDFFAGLGNSQGLSNPERPIPARKSTEQVLNTMHFSQIASAESETQIMHQDSTGASIPISTQDSPEDLLATSMAEDGAKDNLAALLEAELDDDLLDDTVDPTSFFGDGDDGFLNEGDMDPSMQHQAVVEPPGQSDYQQSLNNKDPNSTSSAAPSYIPTGFDMAAYKRNQSPFQTQPSQPAIIERAQSFADKSKGGYASPYDIPMDVSRPKRAPARGPQVFTRGGSVAPPPPRRSDSVQSGYTGTPTLPPQLSPSMPGRPYSTSSHSATTLSPQRPSSSGFFEELPVAQKPRPLTTTPRFMPQVPPQQSGPPLSTVPQQALQQSSSKLPPQTPQPQLNRFGLVGPAKVMPYADTSDSLASPTIPYQAVPIQSSVAGRYSPSISHPTTGQSVPQQSRTVPPNPYAASTSIARPPSVPHQYGPNKAVPAARSSSANQYRPGDRPVEAPVPDMRQAPGVRRPSLLSHSQNMDELPSPAAPTQPVQEDPLSTRSFARTGQESPPHPFDTKSQHDPPRRGPHLSAHQEIETPRSAYMRPNFATKPRSQARPVESYSISQQAVLTNANRVRAPSMTDNDNFIPPQDPIAHDPLKRWQGAPIFRFGFGGTIVTSFPTRIPRYTQGSRVPLIKCNPGEVRILSAKVLPSNERITTFPGPLKNKNKKKDVLLWLHNSISSLAQIHAELLGHGSTGDEQKRHEEKIMLWKVIATLVEYDGVVDGNPSALDAIRKILSPEASIHQDQQSVTQPFLPAIGSPDVAFKPSAAGSSAIDAIRQLLLTGEREKAIWYSVDQKLWGHAMLIASTMPRDLWKQVAHEFVRNDVKSAGRNTESLAALYDVFAGNWEESVDELVPPSARAGLTLMNKNVNGSPASSGLDGLNRWRETLNLVLSNRAVEDVKAIVAMGQLLASYGRCEAAHICYIFSKVPGLFGGPDDPQSTIVLLGADHKQAPLDCLKDIDGILLTEVLEFVLSVLGPTPSQTFALPHLQSFKLYHAELLAELGFRDEAQQYCDAITSALKANTNRSLYYHSQLSTAVDALGVRLRQAGKEGISSWISRPNVDKVSGSLLKALSGFIAGDEDDASVNSAKADAEGPFARINGNTPEMISRNSSPAVGSYGQYGASQNYGTQNLGSFNPLVPAAGNSRYAPVPSTLSEQSLPVNRGYEARSGAPSSAYSPYQPHAMASIPTQQQQMSSMPNVSKYSLDLASQHRIPSDLTSADFEGRRSPQSDAETSQQTPDRESRIPNNLLSLAPRSTSHRSTSVSNSNRYSPAPDHASRTISLEPHYSSSTFQPRSYAHSPSRDPAVPHHVDSYEPSVPLYGDHSNEATSISRTDNETVITSNSDPLHGKIDKEEEHSSERSPIPPASMTDLDARLYGGYEPPSAGYEPPSAGYEPPSYSYEPPSYDPEATEGQEIQSPKKKKSYMDLEDDEDDLASRAAALEKSQKAARDKEAEDNVRRAAEEDARKAAAARAGGGWLSGIWGRGSREGTQARPKASRIFEGEKNSFVFDKELNKWVNTKSGAETASVNTPTPPPPKGPPKPTASAGPSGARPPTSNPMNGPPSASMSGSGSPGLGTAPPPGPQGGLMPGLAPPSRPGTGMSGASNASSIDDLMGPAQPRKGGTMKKGKKRAGYVDVLADKT